MTRSIASASCRVAAAAMLTATMLLATTDMVRAETADERTLRGAAADGNHTKVENFLAKGTDPNVPDYNGQTAVHYAAGIADARILATLLGAGGDPDRRDSMGVAPLHLAAFFPYFEPASQAAIRELLKHGANPNLADSNRWTPLHLVARMHQNAVSVVDLLRAGADPNWRGFDDGTPLHSSVSGPSKFSIDVVAALVNGGARGNLSNSRGETPLQLFVRVGTNDGRIVDALVDAGADPDSKNPDGETPLHTAIRNGGSSESDTVVEALLAAGADPCIKDAKGYIPYNTAREGGRVHAMLANAGGSDIGCQGSDAPVADYIVDPADWPGETMTPAIMRSGPGRDYGVLEILDADTAVQVTGTVRNTNWLRIEVAGDTAFINASLVNETEIATAMETSHDAESAVEEANARIEAEQAETDENLATIDSENDAAQMVAAITEDVPEEMGGESGAQSSEPPSPICSSSTEGPGCWVKVSNMTDCYIWFNNKQDRTKIAFTWSGLCEGYKASGTGDLVWTFGPDNEFFTKYGHGLLVDGILQGRWVESSQIGGNFDGTYENGERHGYWSHTTSTGECATYEYFHDKMVVLQHGC